MAGRRFESPISNAQGSCHDEHPTSPAIGAPVSASPPRFSGNQPSLTRPAMPRQIHGHPPIEPSWRDRVVPGRRQRRRRGSGHRLRPRRLQRGLPHHLVRQDAEVAGPTAAFPVRLCRRHERRGSGGRHDVRGEQRRRRHSPGRWMARTQPCHRVERDQAHDSRAIGRGLAQQWRDGHQQRRRGGGIHSQRAGPRTAPAFGMAPLPRHCRGSVTSDRSSTGPG